MLSLTLHAPPLQTLLNLLLAPAPSTDFASPELRAYGEGAGGIQPLLLLPLLLLLLLLFTLWCRVLLLLLFTLWCRVVSTLCL